MQRQIFLNLAVKDLTKTQDFFKALGFEFNPQFTDEKAACMIVNDDAFVMLLQEKYLKEFTEKELIDAHKQVECLIAVSADSEQAVTDMVNKAVEMGGKIVKKPEQVQEIMFYGSFLDLDGHHWEVVYMPVR